MYKVTTKNLQSAIINYSWTLSVNYRIGAWVSAKPEVFQQGYGLCVFETLEHARSFVGRDDDLVIFKCEVQNVVINVPPRLFVFKYQHDGSLVQDGSRSAYNWPAGTVIVEKVKLLYKIDG